MNDPIVSSDLLRLHTETMILKILLSGDHYGYEIVKLIQQNSGGEYELNESTIYTRLKRMVSGGSIECYWGDEIQGSRRKYYYITEKGKITYDKNKKNWEYARRILDDMVN